MRGDSRLDLYAKSLALIGLASLGVAGALIDYWPGATPLPVTAAVNARRFAPTAHTPLNARYFELGLVQSAASMAGGKPRAREKPARKAAGLVTEKLLDGTLAPGSSSATARDAADLPIEEARLHAALPTISLDAPLESPADNASVDQADTLTERQHMAPSSPAGDRSEDGLLSGVFKRTSSSVSSSLGKASNSLVGAVRTVGGVVRKAF